MIREMLYQGPPLVAAQIAAAEARLGCRFPPEYRAHLLRYNGGRPEPSDFPLSASGGSVIGSLFSITGAATRVQRGGDLVHNNERKRATLPPGMLAIGYDMGGNALCLAVDGPQRGAVFFLDHEETVGQPLAERFSKIADSFAQFVDSLGWRSG